MTNLTQIRTRLQALMDDERLRPFVCDGSPLDCRVFIVGANPATTLKHGFWHYWSDQGGFNKGAFTQDYLALRRSRGARPRIQAIVSQFPPGWCLETNICSKPTKRAADLSSRDHRTEIIRFLLEAIRPRLVFVHSNEPIRFFQTMTGCGGILETPTRVTWAGHHFLLCGRPGPLWTMRIKDAESLGVRLAAALVLPSMSDLPTIEAKFAERFRNWALTLPDPDVTGRRAGCLTVQGWTIHYRFGSDKEGEYLDYYASHRMTDDRHERLYESGRSAHLPAIVSFRQVSADPTEDARLETKYFRTNQEVGRMLTAKGFR